MIPVDTEDLKAWAFRTCNHPVQLQRPPTLYRRGDGYLDFTGANDIKKLSARLNASSNPGPPSKAMILWWPTCMIPSVDAEDP
jgi:hypothetical protein